MIIVISTAMSYMHCGSIARKKFGWEPKMVESTYMIRQEKHTNTSCMINKIVIPLITSPFIEETYHEMAKFLAGLRFGVLAVFKKN